MTHISARQWFDLFQPLLLLVANSSDGRGFLGIDRHLPRVERLAIDSYTADLGGRLSLSEFRTGPRWLRRIVNDWSGFKRLAKQFYEIEVAGGRAYRPVLRIAGELVAAAATDTFYPDASPQTSSCNGQVVSGDFATDQSFSTLRSGAGDSATTGVTGGAVCGLLSGTGSNTYNALYRGAFIFDTSPIPNSDSVDSATLTLYGTAVVDQLGGSQAVGLASFTPSSNTSLVASDFTSFGSTEYASRITLAAWATGDAANTFTLNSSGKSHISTTNVTGFGCRLSCDIDNSAPTWASGENAYGSAHFADTTPATDPTLVVTHSVSAGPTPHYNRRLLTGGFPKMGF